MVHVKALVLLHFFPCQLMQYHIVCALLLGFSISVEHPHANVVKTCSLVKGKFSYSKSYCKQQFQEVALKLPLRLIKLNEPSSKTRAYSQNFLVSAAAKTYIVIIVNSLEKQGVCVKLFCARLSVEHNDCVVHVSIDFV